jgi:hypothetical protein
MLNTTPSVRISELAALQYAGLPGVSQSCYRALERLVQCGEKIEKVLLITCDAAHAFLLVIEPEESVVIQSGFASGYRGEGPKTLARALHLLQVVGTAIDEVVVDREVFERLEVGALTNRDFDQLRSAKPVRPWRWPDYLYEWRDFVPTVPKDLGVLRDIPLSIPWPLIDLRLSDLAQEFLVRPDDSLLKGYRRLEDALRARVGLDDHGAKLFQKAFGGEGSILTWDGIDSGEQAGRLQLFTGAFLAFRNPLAHREQRTDRRSLLMQFIQLNQLFILEGEAVIRPPANAIAVPIGN